MLAILIFLMLMKQTMLYQKRMWKKKRLFQSQSAQENMSVVHFTTINKWDIRFLASWSGVYLRWNGFIQFQLHSARHLWPIFVSKFNQRAHSSQAKILHSFPQKKQCNAIQWEKLVKAFLLDHLTCFFHMKKLKFTNGSDVPQAPQPVVGEEGRGVGIWWSSCLALLSVLLTIVLSCGFHKGNRI